MRSWPDVSTGRRTRPSFWTSLQDAVDEIEGGEVSLPLAGIADALGAYEPLVNVATRKLDIRAFGGIDDGVTDNTAAFVAAVADAAAKKLRTIELPAINTGVYRVNSTIQINSPGITFESTGQWRPSTAGGAQILYYGTGPLFQLDTDDSGAWDANTYDGTGDFFTLRNLSLKHGATDTALDNGLGNYKAGSYGIRDWRSGEVFLDHVAFENFDYAYWGIQSDINEFSNIKMYYCHSGMYFGPRTDQNTLHRPYFLFNDTALNVDSATMLRVRDAQFVGNGTATNAGVVLMNTYNRDNAIIFDDPWFEQYQGYAGVCPALVDIGVGSPYPVKNVSFRTPFLLCTQPPGTPRADYFIRVGNATQVVVDYPNRDSLANFKDFAASTGSDSGDLLVRGAVEARQYITVDKLSTGTLRLSGEYAGYSASFIDNPNRRLYLGSGSAQDIYMSAPTDGWFEVYQPARASGVTATLSIQRRLLTLTAVPSTGTWVQGDRVLMRDPVEAGTGGSKYVVNGWICVASGTPGTWVEWRVLTGN